MNPQAPEQAAALWEALRSAYAAGDWGRVVEFGGALLAQQPHHWDARQMRALALHRLGRSDEAVLQLQGAEQLPAPAAARVLSQRSAYLLGLEDRHAEADARRACQLDPQCFAAWFNLGLALRRRGDPAAALGAWSSARAAPR